jgi:hypothetical protein
VFWDEWEPQGLQSGGNVFTDNHALYGNSFATPTKRIASEYNGVGVIASGANFDPYKLVIRALDHYDQVRFVLFALSWPRLSGRIRDRLACLGRSSRRFAHGVRREGPFGPSLSMCTTRGPRPNLYTTLTRAQPPVRTRWAQVVKTENVRKVGIVPSSPNTRLKGCYLTVPLQNGTGNFTGVQIQQRPTGDVSLLVSRPTCDAHHLTWFCILELCSK